MTTLQQRAAGHLTNHRDACIVAVVVVWITLLLYGDIGSTSFQQLILGGLTTALLLTLVSGEPSSVRAQVLVAVLWATVMEVLGSIVLQAYTYRLHNIPSFVPPGHGLVYLAALAGARTAFVQRHLSWVRLSAVIAAGAWTLWGLFFSARTDLLGALLCVVLVGCLYAWRSPAVYALAFVITTQLELLGTALGNWRWAEQAGWLTSGNPPSAIAAGYCVIDAVALVFGARLHSASRALLRHQGQWVPIRIAEESQP